MIEPVLHRLVVKQFDVTEKDKTFQSAKAAGILLQGTQMEREQAAVDRGTVVALGPTVFQDFKAELNLQVGDEIVFARHAGKTVRDPEQADNDFTKYIVINDEDVIAILRNEVVDA
jgi:co-chaperonin GroES (HSP10)